ncbi:hypothetical protein UFB30_10000 [Jeotgalibacillus sp. HH7-29]|uniref:Uncharacterized protein n=1 Tax=Jeotgalibacillus haloalkalitolerans TaxID=3104292 RepID=A0ABU5KMU0_9BACL|nr:hypothetical protein [Jeotgalibacillus sp. HH7-29]
MKTVTEKALKNDDSLTVLSKEVYLKESKPWTNVRFFGGKHSENPTSITGIYNF